MVEMKQSSLKSLYLSCIFGFYFRILQRDKYIDLLYDD